eukprot:1162004-Pelagomonas_calceolata.AAC.2
MLQRDEIIFKDEKKHHAVALCCVLPVHCCTLHPSCLHLSVHYFLCTTCHCHIQQQVNCTTVAANGHVAYYPDACAKSLPKPLELPCKGSSLLAAHARAALHCGPR